MRAQRARCAVESNKGKRTLPLDQVCSYKYPLHEAHVSVEVVRNTGAGFQIGSRSGQQEIRLSNKPLKVENRRGVACLRMRATRIRRHRCTAHRSRKVEVAPTWRWCVDVRDWYGK